MSNKSDDRRHSGHSPLPSPLLNQRTTSQQLIRGNSKYKRTQCWGMEEQEMQRQRVAMEGLGDRPAEEAKKEKEDESTVNKYESAQLVQKIRLENEYKNQKEQDLKCQFN